jgi:hypothetical protein
MGRPDEFCSSTIRSRRATVARDDPVEHSGIPSGSPSENAVHFMREFTCAANGEAIGENTMDNIVANNSPAMLFSGRRRLERASYNGSIEASQASDVGSIPIARSIKP